MPIPTQTGSMHLVGLEELQKRWGWFLALGILLVILGFMAIGSSVYATLFTVVFIGWLMVISGVLETVNAFTARAWSGFFLELVTGVLYLVFGFLVINAPLETAIVFTLLLSAFLIVGGIFRIATALTVSFQNWGWLLFHGVINLFLGISIWQQWPLSGLWVIGLFVGIDMVFNGVSLVTLALAVKNAPTTPAKA